jgi:hypothetical protein
VKKILAHVVAFGPASWRLALLALIGAIAPGWQFRSWVAAGIGWAVTFAVLVLIAAAVLVVAIRSCEDQECDNPTEEATK